MASLDSPLRVLFTTSQAGHLTHEDLVPYPQLMRMRYAAGARRPYLLVDDGDSADLIIFCEDNIQQNLMWNSGLRGHPLVRRFPEKSFVLNHEDHPEDWLPGVYTSIRQRRFNPTRHRAGCYCLTFNEYVEPAAATAPAFGPRLLMSFRGDLTSPVRRALVGHEFGRGDVRFTVTQPFLYFGYHRADERVNDGKRRFVDEIIDTMFPLCPAGVSPSSHRLFEVMRLGRPPVIIADEWVPPIGPSWPEFSIRVAERRIADLPSILEGRVDEWVQMGRLARQAYLEWFAPEVQPYRTIQACQDLQLCRRRPEAVERRLWPLKAVRLAARSAAWRGKAAARRAVSKYLKTSLRQR